MEYNFVLTRFKRIDQNLVFVALAGPPAAEAFFHSPKENHVHDLPAIQQLVDAVLLEVRTFCLFLN